MERAQFKQYKQDMRAYLRTAYTDERLAMLLAHAQSGQLSYTSCCCFIGVATANHALRGRGLNHPDIQHFHDAYAHPKAGAAMVGFAGIGYRGAFFDNDETRRRIVIPMIRAEMKRREMAKVAVEQKEELVATCT